MLKILKFAKELWYVMAIILLLLVVQAYCELTLPSYTSDIVDVGIQNKGVAYPIPEEISEQTYKNLMVFLEDEEKDVVDTYYKKDGTHYKADVKKLSAQELEDLEDALLDTEMLVYLFSTDGEDAVKMQKQFLSSIGVREEDADVMTLMNTMPEEVISAIKDSMEEKLEDYPDYMSEAMGIRFVTMEYENLGWNMDAYQMDYLKLMGLKMLAIAVLAMLVSILVGFLSSKLAAYTAKDIRGKVFSKVMSFSNAEMNQFSTSSLITRCTADADDFYHAVSYGSICTNCRSRSYI